MANINFKVDDTIKEQAEAVFKSLGLSTTAAVTMFLRETAEKGQLPFNPNLNPTVTSEKRDIEEKASEICEELGLSLDTAINIFMKALVRERRFPFEITAKREAADE